MNRHPGQRHGRRWRGFADESRDAIAVVGDSLQGQIDLVNTTYPPTPSSASSFSGWENPRWIVSWRCGGARRQGCRCPLKMITSPRASLTLFTLPRCVGLISHFQFWMLVLVVYLNHIGNWTILGYTLLSGAIALLFHMVFTARLFCTTSAQRTLYSYCYFVQPAS